MDQIKRKFRFLLPKAPLLEPFGTIYKQILNKIFTSTNSKWSELPSILVSTFNWKHLPVFFWFEELSFHHPHSVFQFAWNCKKQLSLVKLSHWFFQFSAENFSPRLNKFYIPLNQERVHYDAKLRVNDKNWHSGPRKKLVIASNWKLKLWERLVQLLSCQSTWNFCSSSN